MHLESPSNQKPFYVTLAHKGGSFPWQAIDVKASCVCCYLCGVWSHSKLCLRSYLEIPCTQSMTFLDRKQTGKIIMKFCSGLVFFSVEKFGNGLKESR